MCEGNYLLSRWLAATSCQLYPPRSVAWLTSPHWVCQKTLWPHCPTRWTVSRSSRSWTCVIINWVRYHLWCTDCLHSPRSSYDSTGYEQWTTAFATSRSVLQYLINRNANCMYYLVRLFTRFNSIKLLLTLLDSGKMFMYIIIIHLVSEGVGMIFIFQLFKSILFFVNLISLYIFHIL